jgi:hypothetical protein
MGPVGIVHNGKLNQTLVQEIIGTLIKLQESNFTFLTFY